MTLSQKFHKNLKRARIAKKMSQDDLAKKAELSTSYVSMLERGRRSPPLETLEAFAKALAVPPLSLLS